MSEACCSRGKSSRCSIEAILTIDDRGQILLPKELREKANLKPGDKLAVVACVKEGEILCLTLIHADKLAEGIRQFIGPLLKELIGD